MRRIGSVERIQRFPVKSFRGQRLAETRVALHGLELDRVYAFIDPLEQPSFPWLTGRKVAEMILFTPHLAGTDEQGRAAIDVETPEGARRSSGWRRRPGSRSTPRASARTSS